MYNFPTSFPASTLKKLALLSHRWSGAAFCLLFLWWFLSGIFMMYFDFPEVKDADRLERAEALVPARVSLTAAEAWAKLQLQGTPDAVTLSMFDSRPAYRFRLGRLQTVVYADNGESQTKFPAGLNLRTAASWTGQPTSAAKVRRITEVDQWTVGGVFRNGPLTKYSWADGEEVYVSSATGWVVQYTTRSTRLGAWLGPIPHWLYFTPLRSKPRLWSRIVIWLSGIATVVALLGLFAGLSMYSPAKRYRFAGVPSAIPYTGPKRLHMILGLFFGVLACTWAFSGMLSMDPFPATRASESSRIPDALNGEPFTFEAFIAKSPRQALDQVNADVRVKELEFLVVAGEPYYLAKQDARTSRVIPMVGDPARQFDHSWLLSAVSKAGGIAEAKFIGQYDAYYLDRRKELPLPVLLIQLKDPARSRFYIDPRTARIVGGYSSADWAERWLYHGLHSINFPWLYNNRPAWDIVVLVLMLGGVSLSTTSAIIGWRLVKRLRV